MKSGYKIGLNRAQNPGKLARVRDRLWRAGPRPIGWQLDCATRAKPGYIQVDQSRHSEIKRREDQHTEKGTRKYGPAELKPSPADEIARQKVPRTPGIA